MPNLIVGLKYEPLRQKVETEEELLEVFADLKGHYSRFVQTFKVLAPTGSPVEDFESFLRFAVQEGQSVRLAGSGDIGGLTVKEALLGYDLSAVGDLTKYWDISRDGSCHSCRNYYHIPGGGFVESGHGCEVMDPMDWSHNCEKHDARKKNAKGQPARKLDELVLEAIK